MNKKELFEKLKKKNIFWSFNSTSSINNNILIEYTLLYGDVSEIIILFKIFEKEKIKKVWINKIIPDKRFEGLNYYLGKIFFQIKNIDKFIEERSKEGNRFERFKQIIN